jgi:hypothetical protein
MSKLSVAQVIECRKTEDLDKHNTFCKACFRFKKNPCKPSEVTLRKQVRGKWVTKEN